MDSLIIYHFSRRDNKNLEPALLGLDAPMLVTCQRALAFVSEEQEPVFLMTLPEELQFERLTGQPMYHFMLEIICGLRSSLVGETEIQGQFKEFVKVHFTQSESWIHRWSSLFQSLLSDSKEIRQNYLKDLGSHSYGSLTRKILKETSLVQVIGAGQLVKEIEPWLSEKHLQIYSRKNLIPSFNKKSKGLRESFGLQQIKQLQKAEALVVAAPISNQELLSLISQKPIEKLIDWRGESELEVGDLQGLNVVEYFSFSQLTRQLEEEKKVMTEKLIPAMAQIHKLSEQFFLKMIVRPMGWDDLCA